MCSCITESAINRDYCTLTAGSVYQLSAAESAINQLPAVDLTAVLPCYSIIVPCLLPHPVLGLRAVHNANRRRSWRHSYMLTGSTLLTS